MKTVSILGGTGTIGDNMLDLMRQHRAHCRLAGLSGHRNLDKLLAIVTEFQPDYVAVPNIAPDHPLTAYCNAHKITLLVGPTALEELASVPVDLVVGAIVGMAGLASTIAAAKAGQVIALANKESLVAAGHLVMPMLADYGASIIPVDSEHNAIHQCLMGQERDKVSQLVLTASGGPFFRNSVEELRHVTRAQALKHPNWVMGAKVSIDSATLMNKGLELLEASHLFSAGADDLSAIIHPQSLVHGIVDFIDGSSISHMAHADMRLPLGFALGLGTRLTTQTKPLRLTEAAQLEFYEINLQKFPCFHYAMQIIDAPADQAVVLNASNEVAVDAFLQDRIGFLQIAQVVHNALEKHYDNDATSLDAVFALNQEARDQASDYIAQISS